MAIINCPSCNKKISDVTTMCPNCGFKRGDVSEEQMLEFRRRKLRDHVYHLNMTSYVVLTLFLAAFGWYWWETSGFQEQSPRGPVLLLALGTVAYVLIRVLLFMTRRQLRQIVS